MRDITNIEHGIILNLVSYDRVYVDDVVTFDILKAFPNTKGRWELSIQNCKDLQWVTPYTLQGTAHSHWEKYGHLMVYNCFVKELVGKSYQINSESLKKVLTSIRNCRPTFINNFTNTPEVFISKDYSSQFCLLDVIGNTWPEIRVV